MVSTRRGTANAEPATASMERPKPIQQARETIHVLIPSTKKMGKASLKRKVPSTPPTMVISSTISEHDLSLTSPSTGETPKLLAMSTPKNKQGSVDLSERTVSSAPRRLAPKPFANMSGSCQNPIIVDETTSPLRRAVRAPKRKPRQKKLTEPHQFIGNGYRDLYSYRASRPALAAMPANGSTFTGHQSHDIYRMMNAKITAAPDFSPNAAWGRHTLNVPFEVQYPLSAQVLTQQQNASQHQSPYAQIHQAKTPLNTYGYPMVPSQNEDLLRRRAIQYIRECSRLSPQKGWLSGADPDETSDDEAEKYQQDTIPRPNTSTPQSGSMPPLTVRNIHRHINHKPTIQQDLDPNFLVRHLIEHTSLITSLLQLYPHSTDREGLQNDISMMVQIQNQYVTDWMKAESLDSRKRRKINGGSTISLDAHPHPIITPATKIQNENDNTLRQVFSANAGIWQDGTGHGVADVFAAVPASSPVVSSFDGRIAGCTQMPSISIAHSLPIQEESGTSGSAITTPTKQIPNAAAGAAHWKGLPITPNMEEIRAKFGSSSISLKDNSKGLTNLSHPPSPSKDPEAHTRITLHSINAPINASPNRMHIHSSSHSNHSKHSEHTAMQHAAPSSDDDELYVANNGDASSSFHSDSSNDSRIQRPVFRFEPRVDVADGRAGSNPLSKE